MDFRVSWVDLVVFSRRKSGSVRIWFDQRVSWVDLVGSSGRNSGRDKPLRTHNRLPWRAYERHVPPRVAAVHKFLEAPLHVSGQETPANEWVQGLIYSLVYVTSFLSENHDQNLITT